MSGSLAAMVASASDPATVDELLREAMARLRAEYPDAKVHSVQVTFGVYERTDLPNKFQREQSIEWCVQEDNERGRGSSSREAFEELAANVAEKLLIPTAAARVAEALRGVPDQGFTRQSVIDEARRILEGERKKGTV